MIDPLFVHILHAQPVFCKMADLLLTVFLLLDCAALSLAQSGPEPLQITASDTLHGPDGPWQAVSVQFGSPGQNMDLYPGGIWQTLILTDQLCQDITVNPCGSGGLFDPESSDTLDNTSICYYRGSSGNSSEWTNGAMLFSYGDEAPVRDQLQIAGQTVPNLSALMFADFTMDYPDGKYPLQVGELALGPVVNQSFSQKGCPEVNASLVPGFLNAQNIIPSNSFGLHVGIGAEALKVDLSLWLGGYDASRIVGPVSNQSIQPDANGEFVIDLLDIGISVDHGGSPFSYSSQEGLLSSGNSSISSAGIPVYKNPGAPYLNLPNSTCAAIARDLPVTYNTHKALYMWNVTDPQFAKIVTSPTYLSFVFRGVSGNLTINTPFQLLNLTLQAPLVSTPTPYFPCQAPQGDIGTFSLGRAFLQSAFIGVSWVNQGVGQWYLAQAPGPNTDTNPQSKPIIPGTLPVGLTSNWTDTWSGFWTALPASTIRPTPPNPASPIQTSPPARHDLSGGAIAGIAIGTICAVLVVLEIGFLLFRRRRHGIPEAVPFMGQDDAQALPAQQPSLYWNTGTNAVEKMATEEPVRELPAS